MGFLTTLLGGNIQANTPPPDDDFWYGAVGQTSQAGVKVSPETAMTISTVFRCVSAIGQDVAGMPLKMYRRLERGKEEARNHPLYELLHDQPNTWQTAFEWREMMLGHLLLRGNAYNLIVPGARGFADQLIPLHPGRMKVEQLENRRLRYTYNWENGRQEIFTQDEIFHLRGLSSDGIVGLSVVALARDSFGLGIATERYGARFFGNNAMPGGVLQSQGKLSPVAQARLRDSWQKLYGGVDRSHNIAVLEEGLTWQQVGLSNEDSQFLETRNFQIEEVARWFGVPLHRIGHTEKATSWGTGIEQFNIGYIVYTLQPWLVRIEQAIRRDLILAKETFFAEFLIDGLLRGDSKTRAESHRISIMTGYKTRNEAREQENQNPLPGLDEPLVPLNMATVDEDGNILPISGGGSSAGQSAPMGLTGSRAQMLALEAAARVIRKETTAIKKASARYEGDDEGFETWLLDFYNKHAGFVADVLHVDADAAADYAEMQRYSVMMNGTEVIETWLDERAPKLAALALGEVIEDGTGTG